MGVAIVSNAKSTAQAVTFFCLCANAKLRWLTHLSQHALNTSKQQAGVVIEKLIQPFVLLQM